MKHKIPEKAIIEYENHHIFGFVEGYLKRRKNILHNERPDMVKTVNDPLVEDRRWLGTSRQTGSPT